MFINDREFELGFWGVGFFFRSVRVIFIKCDIVRLKIKGWEKIFSKREFKEGWYSYNFIR